MLVSSVWLQHEISCTWNGRLFDQTRVVCGPSGLPAARPGPARRGAWRCGEPMSPQRAELVAELWLVKLPSTGVLIAMSGWGLVAAVRVGVTL